MSVNHWFLRWLTLTWGVHIIAQIGAIFALSQILSYGEELDAILEQNRYVVVFLLIVHFVAYLFAELLSVERSQLDQIVKDELGNDDEQ